MQQKPITYLRQVVSGTVNPELLASGDASGENNNGVIPTDASEQGKLSSRFASATCLQKNRLTDRFVIPELSILTGIFSTVRHKRAENR
jgi:hypothetical protein